MIGQTVYVMWLRRKLVILLFCFDIFLSGTVVKHGAWNLSWHKCQNTTVIEMCFLFPKVPFSSHIILLKRMEYEFRMSWKQQKVAKSWNKSLTVIYYVNTQIHTQ